MPDQPAAPALWRRVASRTGAARVARSALVAVRRRRQTPVLSVVVPVYNVERYLAEALDSILRQDVDLELIAVDDGSTDGSLRILRDYERRDHRVRVLSQANAGQGVARNHGVEIARGEFLTFVDSDDTVPRGSFAYLIGVLRDSGSDFAMGGIRRMQYGRFFASPWRRTVHGVDRIGTTVDDFPAVLDNIIACNRVFRTAFWRARVGGFRGGIAYEDHVPMLAAYLRAERFDVLSRVTYHWRQREDSTSTSQQKADLRNLQDRVEVKEEAHAMLLVEASPLVYDAWVTRCLEIDLPMYAARVLDAGEAYRDLLARTYRTFVERADGSAAGRAWLGVRVFSKVRAHLIARERWEDLVEANDWFLRARQLPPTTVSEGVLLAALPEAGWARGLPDSVLAMSPVDARFEGLVDRVDWREDRVVVGGWLRHRCLDVTDPEPDLALWLEQGGERVSLPLTRRPVPEANLWSPTPYAGCATTGFETEVAYASLGDEVSRLGGRLASSGLVSEGRFLERLADAPGADPGHHDAVIDGRPVRIVARRDFADGLSLVVEPVQAQVSIGSTSDCAAVELVEARDDRLLVHLSGTAETAELSGAGLTMPGEVSGNTTVFPVRLNRFGETGEGLPAGDYELLVDGIPLPPSRLLLGRLPEFRLGDRQNLRLALGKDGQLIVRSLAPLAPGEIGEYHRVRLEGAVATAAGAETLVLAGPVPGANERAVAAEIARIRPDLTRIWGLADRSVPLPPGERGLIVGSEAWHRAVAGSRILVGDGDLGSWVPHVPGRLRVRTFPVQPFEAMGLSLWRSLGYPPARIYHELAEIRRQRRLIVAPHEEAAEHYREEYGYEGRILVTGDPRTDLLVAGDRDRLRADLLTRLGLAGETRLVLWAPVDRDPALAGLARRRRSEALDQTRLADLLGPGYSVLSLAPDGAAGVVDVSAYPRREELLVAADLAVFDYSAQRLDWALTGRPAVFFAPDAEEFLSLRPPLFDFEETAPGPIVTTTEAVAEAVLAGEPYAERVAAVNARFNALHDGHAAQRLVAALLEEL